MIVEHCTSKVNALTANPKQGEGPASSDSDEHSALRNLPFDLKDHILSLIDSPRDLLALSLTSREWGAIILPLHIRYRELRIRANQPEIWQHLATRTDLAKNIRKVCLMTHKDHRDQRLPLTLDTAHRILEDQPEMIQALSHFESLTSFTWLGPDQHCQLSEQVFGALTNCNGLVELILGAVCPRKNHLNPESSIWRIQNLRILTLKGFTWASLGDAESSFISMLNNSPALEELTVPYNHSSVKFTSCRFRSLIKLHLDSLITNVTPAFAFGVIMSNTGASFISNGDLQTTNNLIIDFLFAHPMIQDLFWYPVYPSPFLPRRLLPTLKHLSTNPHVMAALLCDNTVIKSRMLETISSVSLDLDTLRLLGTINGSRLQEIHLEHCDGVDLIRRLAALIPTIRILGMPGSGISSKRYFDEYIDCFGEFPLLEHLYDASIWRAIQARKADKKEELIRKLYTRCSALKTIRLDVHLRREIVFFRDGFDVTWKQTANDW